MSATDELRKLLDERGVEWEAWNDCITAVPPSTHYLEVSSGTLCAVVVDATPTQAVEATLGRGECKVDVLNTGDCAGYECSEYIMHCNACGHEFGHVLYNEDGDVWMSEPPKFCPNCGREVENDG